MFSGIVCPEKLTGGRSDSFFHNIRALPYNTDHSMTATLRALLVNRIGEKQKLCTHRSRIQNSYLSLTRFLRNNTKRDLVRMVESRYLQEKDYLVIQSTDHKERDANELVLNAFELEFCNLHPGFEQVQSVTEFFKKRFHVLCFINRETKTSFVITERMTLSRWHSLQSFIPVFLPWFFEESGITEQERELLHSLIETKQTHYEECIQRFADAIDFRALDIKSKLSGFETSYIENKKNTCEGEIESLRNRLADLINAISQYTEEIQDKNSTLNGLELQLAQTNKESELMNFFLSSKNLFVGRVDDGELVFVVKDTLEMFDEDLAARVIENRDSCVYYPDGYREDSPVSHDDMERLMRAVFIDQKLKIRVCAAYSLNLSGWVGAVERYGGFDSIGEFSDCMPNPHIDRYACMGNYAYVINEILANHNFIGAVLQCVASCKSLNFGDSTVLKEFVRQIYGTASYCKNNRCFELPNGSVVNPEEAIDWLRAQEVRTNE